MMSSCQWFCSLAFKITVLVHIQFKGWQKEIMIDKCKAQILHITDPSSIQGYVTFVPWRRLHCRKRQYLKDLFLRHLNQQNPPSIVYVTYGPRAWPRTVKSLSVGLGFMPSSPLNERSKLGDNNKRYILLHAKLFKPSILGAIPNILTSTSFAVSFRQLTSAIAAISQVAPWRPLKLVNKVSTTVLHLNVVFVVAALISPVITDRSGNHAVCYSGVPIIQPPRGLSPTPHGINTFGWHDNTCQAFKSVPSVVCHCIGWTLIAFNDAIGDISLRSVTIV